MLFNKKKIKLCFKSSNYFPRKKRFGNKLELTIEILNLFQLILQFVNAKSNKVYPRAT